LQEASIRLYDAVGREVTRTQATSNTLELNTSDLAPGLYVLSLIRNGSGRVMRTLIKE
jgi:hypothetical protein